MVPTGKGVTAIAPLILIAFIIIFGAGLAIGRSSINFEQLPKQHYKVSPTEPPLTAIIPYNIATPIPSYKLTKTCKHYGVLDKKDYLDTYTVKKGDSILSIARTKLGSSDRVNEIVKLNQDRYPIAFQNSFLEVGWKLYLPPSYIASSTGNIEASEGEVALITPQYFAIALQPTDTPGMDYVYPHEDPKFDKPDLVTLGDCVRAVYEGSNHKLLGLWPQ